MNPSNRLPVRLERNTDRVVGWVQVNDLGLWEGWNHSFNASCGPFGTRFDAELEVISMWERAIMYFDRMIYE